MLSSSSNASSPTSGNAVHFSGSTCGQRRAKRGSKSRAQKAPANSWKPNQPNRRKMSKIPSVTDANFSEEVGPSSGLVAVDFTAAWCPPCRIVGKMLEEFADEYASRIEVR